VCIRNSYLRATSQNSSKTNYKEPEKDARSFIAISRLFRNTYMSEASLAVRTRRTTFAPLNTTDISASNTLVLRPRENDLRLILYLY
jgi:hypothetical protein